MLNEEESKHCAQVLRHQEGDKIMVFNGLGDAYTCTLTRIHKKQCEFIVDAVDTTQKKPFSIHLGIAPTKNTDRIEWMLEKLCEIGVDKISFIQTKNSERKKLRIDRMEKKAISAMKQSKNPWLIKINELDDYSSFLKNSNEDVRLIAHVDSQHTYISKLITRNTSVCILIGPEGDFTLDEVRKAKDRGFNTVSLGHNTLRTETAGLIACCAVNTINEF